MVRTRAEKVRRVADGFAKTEPYYDREGDVLVIGWGGTYGSITTAVQRAQRKGLKVAQAHLRYLNPMPKNTAAVLRSYKKIVVPEVNAGQLAFYLRAQFPGVDPIQHNRINGKALKITELVAKVNEILG
jgi:2-oxoglutarate ferredoxin oxidoreductase subunit alpha